MQDGENPGRQLVSRVLEDELRTKVRLNGVVVWLDREGVYSGFVDQRVVTGPRDVRFVGYRGSYLEVMLGVEALTSGAERPALVVHVPGVTPEQLTRSPLLELWKSGTTYERRLDTLITTAASGRARPDQIAELQAKKPTLDEADAWLAEVVAAGAAGIRNQLVGLTPVGFVDDLIGRGPMSQKLHDPVDRAAIFEQLEVWLGLSAAWREATIPEGEGRAESVLFAVASFALAVEYVFDLKRPPQAPRLVPLERLAGPLCEACRLVARHLRARHPELYQRIADQTEAELQDEVEIANADDLGKIDTFRFEEDKVLLDALDALGLGDWEKALEHARSRAEPQGDNESIWTKRPDRRAAWLLVRDAALLGEAVNAAPVVDVANLDELVQAYAARGAAVDRAHRVLEQRRITALFPEIPHFERVRRSVDALREVWAEWADGWARAMARISRERGFLPSARLLQRTIFEDVVVPLVRDAKDGKTGADLPTALFVVDALRFEMADELFREMAATPHTEASLQARLAELPSITCVGMNAIAPTASGAGVPTLRPILSEGAHKIGIEGFSTGAFKVDARPARWRAMFDRAGGDCFELSLDAVVSHEATALKRRVARSRLVVVHSLELDDAGESGVGPMVFDQVQQKLRAAWRLLRDADVRRFVITSDHGFLMLDGIDRVEAYGRKIDPERRHVLTRSAAVEPGRVRVPLGELGYLGADGVFLVVSETINVFDRGAKNASFVHGGNSLQERVVPVIAVVHRSATGSSTGRYRVAAEAALGVGGMHRVRATVGLEAQSQMSLAFTQAKHVDLTMRVADGMAGQVEIVQAGDGAAVVSTSTLRAEVGKTFEVFFRVSNASHERVRVELGHIGSDLVVEAAVVADWFEAAVAQVARAAPVVTASWLDGVTVEYRELYARLAKHGVLGEAEVVQALGSQRAARRFGNTIADEGTKLPFGVRVEATEGGKRWVREGGAR